MREVRIYDNGGESFDRFTVFNGQGDVFAMSENPLSPQGFNQYIGSEDQYSDAILGVQVYLDELPEEVQRAIKERCEPV